MDKDIIRLSDWQAGEIKTGLLAILAAMRVGAEGVKRSRTARIVCWVILAVLVMVLEGVIVGRIAQRDAERNFEAWRERYVNDFLSQQEAAQRGMPVDPKVQLAEQEITALSKMCYGVKNNSDADIARYVWAVFNRVDIKSGEFKDMESIEEVLAKPEQFMSYVPGNDYPVLARIENIVRTQYENWKSGKGRPCDVEYVFAYWTPDKIVLLKSLNDLIHVFGGDV